MEKHEHMVIHNRRTNQAKADRAIATMNKMFNDDEQVVVCKLVKKTGLSRAFFYNNAAVHDELVRLQELQSGKSFVAPQKAILDKAMEKEIQLLKKRIAEKDAIISQMKLENEKLKKAANAHVLSTINSL